MIRVVALRDMEPGEEITMESQRKCVFFFQNTLDIATANMKFLSNNARKITHWIKVETN